MPSAVSPSGIGERLRLSVGPRALQHGAVVAAGEDEVEQPGLAGFERRARPDSQILVAGLGDQFRRRREIGRFVRRIARRQHGEHVDDERQRVAGLDHVALRLVAVGEVAGDVELPALAGCGADEALVPSLDDATLAERDRKRAPAVVAVELLAVLAAHADVVHVHGVALDRLRALAGRERRDDELGRDGGGDGHGGHRHRHGGRRDERHVGDAVGDRRRDGVDGAGGRVVVVVTAAGGEGERDE